MNLQGTQIQYRYVDRMFNVYIPTDMHKTSVVKSSRFLTTYFPKVNENVVLTAFASRDACDTMCKTFPSELDMGSFETNVAGALDVAEMLNMPLLVQLNSYCDIDTHQEICEAFFARPSNSTSSLNRAFLHVRSNSTRW